MKKFAGRFGLTLLLTGVAVWCAGPGLLEAFGQGQLRNCQSNLSILGQMSWSWAQGHEGRFPSTLDVLVRAGQLRKMPTCPSAGAVTYAYEVAADEKNFTLTCRGDNHRRVVGWEHPQPRWPETTSRAGLTRPDF